ncbi:MAG: hypothetical protein K8R60_01900 [Burkholderiales bacterium]|nr:hypothetical protein [Burkholderiales bacterium]
MREPFELVHHNRYRVSCRPELTPDGTFLARVVVSWIDDDGSVLDHRLRPELAPFPTAAEAADVGRDAALRWLDALESGATKALAAESARRDREAYAVAQREWRTAAAAFETSMQRLAASAGPADPAEATRVAIDAAALKRLHERWLETAVHLAVVQRR